MEISNYQPFMKQELKKWKIRISAFDMKVSSIVIKVEFKLNYHFKFLQKSIYW